MSSIIMGKMSRSSSFYMDRKKQADDKHFQWDSFQKFIYIAYTYSSSTINFDIFSMLSESVTLMDFIIFEITLGMGYMVMDFFIKQYTGKIDFNSSLNPLLKGLTYGLLLQTALWTLLHSTDLADALRYFAASFYGTPLWAKCHKSVGNNCVSSSDMLQSCLKNKRTLLNVTSAHLNYQFMFQDRAKSFLTSRFFIMALVWICNFFMATVTDQTLNKIFKIAFIFRTVSTLITSMFIMTSKKDKVLTAITHIININAAHSWTSAFIRVTYVYGIGFVGVYDFGTMSPYTLIDNAVVIFAFTFTIVAFLRSVITRILYLLLKSCVIVDSRIKYMSAHYLIFAMMPLGSELLSAHKYYVFYVYFNLMVSLSVCIALLTLTMTKLLHKEFRTVNSLYIVGILCFVGFGLSVSANASFCRKDGFIHGLNVVMLYLGGTKAAIVMWIYGVDRFSTDVHFWLGYKPTKFWTLSWTMLPVGCFYFLARKIHKMIYFVPIEDDQFLDDSVVAYIWICFSFLIVIICLTKTVVRYMTHNNLAGVFRHSAAYGPIELDDRKRRENFDVSTHCRQCQHNCMLLDEEFDCLHTPVMFKASTTSDILVAEQSMTYIYESGLSRKPRTSSMMDVDTLHIS